MSSLAVSRNRKEYIFQIEEKMVDGGDIMFVVTSIPRDEYSRMTRPTVQALREAMPGDSDRRYSRDSGSTDRSSESARSTKSSGSVVTGWEDVERRTKEKEREAFEELLGDQSDKGYPSRAEIKAQRAAKVEKRRAAMRAAKEAKQREIEEQKRRIQMMRGMDDLTFGNTGKDKGTGKGTIRRRQGGTKKRRKRRHKTRRKK